MPIETTITVERTKIKGAMTPVLGLWVDRNRNTLPERTDELVQLRKSGEKWKAMTTVEGTSLLLLRLEFGWHAPVGTEFTVTVEGGDKKWVTPATIVVERLMGSVPLTVVV